MTIGNARKFIARGLADPKLRSALNGATSREGLNKILDEEALSFTPQEFEEAWRHELTLCQFEEEADRRKEFKAWWDLLNGLVTSPGEDANSSCSQANQCNSSGGCAGCAG